MTTGLKKYDALHKAISETGVNSLFPVNPGDAKDLCKLTSSDLVARGYSEEIAESVSSALLNGNLGPLGKSMGSKLAEGQGALKLPEKDA